ncbi:MAG TPA: hypothetical protein VGL29_25765 [Blastocatellia bacterium]
MISWRGKVNWILRTFAAMGVLNLAFGVAGDTPSARQTRDPRHTMVTALSASGPNPSLGDEARTFDRLTGTWDCDFSFISEDGSVRHSPGELMFGWILDGRAVQDIWITYPKEGSKERGIGTTVRFFDDKSKLWQVVFVSPAYAALIRVQGGAEGDRIVLRGVDDQGSMLRWTFNDIKPSSFIWRGETSRDGGKSWRLEEEHHMRRRSGTNSTEKAKPKAPAGDPQTDMIRTLQASGPHASLGKQAQLFDRFVGTWDLDCVLYGADGKTTRFRGEWIFGWSLDGWIMQDVLIISSQGERSVRGTTLRFYDGKAGQWRVVWIAPVSGNVIALRGGAVGDRIVLEGLDVDDARLRWSFNEIQTDSFLWRGETSAHDGKSWRVEQEMRLKRRTVNPAGS